MSIIIQVPSNDLKAIKVAENVLEYNEMLGRSLKNSLLRHILYLAENVATMSLADPNIDDEETALMIQELMKYPKDISYFDLKKPGIRDDIIIDKNTQLHELEKTAGT